MWILPPHQVSSWLFICSWQEVHLRVVSRKAVLAAPWLACVTVDGKFVSILSAFLSLTEAMMYCTWGHLFMGLLTLMASEATW